MNVQKLSNALSALWFNFFGLNTVCSCYYPGALSVCSCLFRSALRQGINKRNAWLVDIGQALFGLVFLRVVLFSRVNRAASTNSLCSLINTFISGLFLSQTIPIMFLSIDSTYNTLFFVSFSFYLESRLVSWRCCL